MGYEPTMHVDHEDPSAHINFLTCRAPAWRGVPVKKAAAEASMQRSKKARMVALFVVLDHVMCLFSAWAAELWLVPSCVSGQKRHAESTVRITLRRRPRTKATNETSATPSTQPNQQPRP